MSRKLQTVKEQYISNPTLPTLIEYLEQCKKESLWNDMTDIVANWNGAETPELHFYKGIALINLGKKEEGAKELKKVIQINPNHFAAKRELDSIGGFDDPEEPVAVKQTNDALKKILIIEPRLEEETRSRAIILKNIGLALIGIAAILLTGYFFLREDKADKYKDLLSNPEASFTSMNYGEYINTVRDYKIIDIRDDIGEPIKKCILWMTAFAVMDYRLDYEKEDTTQLKMFYTLVSEKDPEIVSLVDYIEGRGVPSGIALYHKLDKEYPASLNQIKALKIEIPSQISKENLRESFYKALMLFRRSEFKQSADLVNNILAVFPDHELTQKLKIMIKAGSAEKDKGLSDISADLAVLDKWKTLSIERYYYGEAKILLGFASEKDDVLADGFYSVCPGRYFCVDIVKHFLKNENTREASRMALYMKEQKENQRDAQDIKLVIETSFAEGDYSNCYFSFRELAQFFPEEVDDDSLMRGAQCSEKNGYYEEAVSAYEKIIEKTPKIEIKARILKMKYRLSGEEMYFNQLKDLSNKNPDNVSLLYSYLDALSRKNNINETVEILERIYPLETPDKKGEIINEFLKQGAVAQAVKHLQELKGDKKYRKMLIDIYNRYMLFDKADELLAHDEVTDPVWFFFREQLALKEKGEYKVASENIDKKMETYDKCEPAFLLLKAELFRNQGDKQRTFGMIDSMLECAPHYLPGLVLAAEITYYQGDLTKSRDGIAYILENEKFLSPGVPYYHNYLVLLNAEILVAVGKESTMLSYLQKNLLKNMVLGVREQEKIDDVSEKLNEPMQQALNSYLRRNFKFSAPKTDL
ncbi:MAG TPA: hypothetical protein PKG52_08955 [bacterium]|nr:hypothetical protein [bacterium]HPS31068.1 hypothetical protein [bacterium]